MGGGRPLGSSSHGSRILASWNKKKHPKNPLTIPVTTTYKKYNIVHLDHPTTNYIEINIQ